MLFPLLVLFEYISICNAWTFNCGDPSKGAVLNGTDLVALKQYYYNATGTPDIELKPLNNFIGSPQYSYNLNQYTFYFINSTTKNIFINSPLEYIPQFGGYCAFGLTGYDTHEPNPPGYALSPSCTEYYIGYAYIQYKLYTFLNLQARNTFMSEYDMLINSTQYNFNEIKSNYNNNTQYCFNTASYDCFGYRKN